MQSSTLVVKVTEKFEDPLEEKKVYENFEYYFKNFGQYAVSSLCFCLTPISYIYFDQSEPNHPPIVILIAAGVVVCLPIYYMEVFLGRYTQNSILHLKYMVPIAKGHPYVQLAVTVLYTIESSIYLTDTLLYFLMCFQFDLPWTICPSNITERCYYHQVPKGCTNCTHSAMAYWKYIYMQKPALTYSQVRLGLPILHRFVSCCICWLFIFLITATAYKQRHKCLSILLFIYCTTMVVLVTMILLNFGATKNLPNIFNIGSYGYLQPSNWAEALIKSMKLMKLGHAHHVLAGSRIPPNTSIGLWCVYFYLLLMIISMINTIFNTAVESVQHYHTGAKPETVLYLNQLFVVSLPGGLTYTGAAHAWSAVFFLSITTILIANIVLRIITLHLNITNFKPSLHKYKLYLLFGYCLSLLLVSTLLLSEKHYFISRLIMENTTMLVEVIITALFIIVVFWIYGVRTVSDDILFLTNHKPIPFWVWTWYLCPLAFILLTVYIVAKTSNTSMYLIAFLSSAVFLSPLLVSAVYQLLVYIRKRRLIGLIEPEAEWGMPDPESRHMRRIFNPRTETKFDSKRRVCSHKCIQNSSYLRTVLHYEALNRSKLLNTEEVKPINLSIEDEELESEN